MSFRPPRASVWRYMIAAASVGGLTAGLLLFRATLAPANLVMLYVPLVAAIALVAGRRASAVASLLAFLAYNFFFVPPLYTIAAEQQQDVIELVTLLTVALLIGTLVARSRAQAEQSAERAERMTALYEVSQEISATLSIEEILPRIARLALRLLRAKRVVIRLVVDDGPVTYETVVGARTPVGNNFQAPLMAGGIRLGEMQVWLSGEQRLPEHELRPLLTTL